MRVRKGWTQHVLRDGGRVCAIGAIEAVAASAEGLSIAQRSLERILEWSIGPWNDFYAESAEEVAMTMELCALLVEEGNDAVQG